LKPTASQHEPEVPATDFKAHCLELMREVHDRKCNSITVTKRGKPFVRVVPIREETETLYGCLRGLAKVRGDLTRPLGIRWEALRGSGK